MKKITLHALSIIFTALIFFIFAYIHTRFDFPIPLYEISDKCQSFGFYACAILEIFIALIIGAIIGAFIGKYLSKRYL